MAAIRVDMAPFNAITKRIEADPDYKPPPKPGEDPEYDKRLREYQNWDPALVTVLPSEPREQK